MHGSATWLEGESIIGAILISLMESLGRFGHEAGYLAWRIWLLVVLDHSLVNKIRPLKESP